MTVTPFPPDEDARPRSRPRAGWWALVVGLIGVVVLIFVPTPYVVQQPGPVFDTIGTVELEDDEVDMLQIDAETYETTGSLDLLTVSVVGSRSTPLDWFTVIRSWFNPSLSVLPLDAVYPRGVSFEDREEQNRLLMENSQREAVAAALRELGHDVRGVLTVQRVVEGAPADGLLEPGDRILEADGRTPEHVSELRVVFAGGGEVDVVVERDGEEVTLTVVPEFDEEAGMSLIGVEVLAEYDFPFEVTVTLERVGGPSAGMMLALGIIDKLTPGALTGGERIAGTGTITAAGEVGTIGGARQKVFGAAEDGADWMLVPRDNCADLGSERPSGITVIPVATLDEALESVEAIARGDGMSLEAC